VTTGYLIPLAEIIKGGGKGGRRIDKQWQERSHRARETRKKLASASKGKQKREKENNKRRGRKESDEDGYAEKNGYFFTSDPTGRFRGRGNSSLPTMNIAQALKGHSLKNQSIMFAQI